METGIGATLREARNRRKLDLAEVEAAIKIRVRYLRAMENEEWDVLPGGAYTRGFIRTYASHLGLDGERLADEYRSGASPAAPERISRGVEPVPGSPRNGQGFPGGGRAVAVLISLALLAAVLAIGLTGGGGDDPAPAPKKTRAAGDRRADEGRTNVADLPGVAVSLEATAEVWVCMLDSEEDAVVEGEILAPGAEAGPFRGDGFTIALGNGEVELTVDGRRAETAASAGPVGYAIDARGELTSLEEGERPDCT